MNKRGINTIYFPKWIIVLLIGLSIALFLLIYGMINKRLPVSEIPL